MSSICWVRAQMQKNAKPPPGRSNDAIMLVLQTASHRLGSASPRLVAVAIVLAAACAECRAEGAAARLKSAIVPSPAAPQSKQTAGRAAEQFPASREGIRVVFRSYETAAISAEINARITHLPKREGDRFKRGELLVGFDCRKIVAELDAVQAAMKAKRAEYETQIQLIRYNATGTLAVAQAKHELEKVEADVRGIEAKRSGCTIEAPFDGRVVEKIAQTHEIAQPNQSLLRIINEAKMELVLMVPSAWLPRISLGQSFRIKVDENGEIHEARIVQSTGLIDPVSQSARLIGELVTAAPTIVPGMSGTALFANNGAGR